MATQFTVMSSMITENRLSMVPCWRACGMQGDDYLSVSGGLITDESVKY